MNSQPDTGEVLAGLVERVTYHNAENGFLGARARGHRDVVTVVGHAAVISAGEWIMASNGFDGRETLAFRFRRPLNTAHESFSGNSMSAYRIPGPPGVLSVHHIGTTCEQN